MDREDSWHILGYISRYWCIRKEIVYSSWISDLIVCIEEENFTMLYIKWDMIWRGMSKRRYKKRCKEEV